MIGEGMNGSERHPDERSAQRLSARVQSVPPSAIRHFFDMANELKGQVLSLSIGEPDFVTPWQVREAGIYSLETGHTHYTANQGLIELREAIVRYSRERFDLHYDPRTEVVVTVGGSEAIDNALRALTDPGDEVLVPEPCFVCYKSSAMLAGAVPVPIALDPANGFKLTPEQLEAAITPRTRLIVLGYPNNPTGAVMTRSELMALLPVFERHPQVSVISDELYAELTYGGEPHASIAALRGMRERTAVIGGFSKAFAMTGWRIGYALAPAPIAAAINKIHQYVIMSAPTTAQHAAVEALNNCVSAVEDMVTEYNYRRQYIYNRLKAMGLSCMEPKGAFYIFPDISRTGLSSMAFCERLLQEQKVAIIPGSAFGACGEGHARISYAASLETIEAAMDRLADFLNNLSVGDSNA